LFEEGKGVDGKKKKRSRGKCGKRGRVNMFRKGRRLRKRRDEERNL